jgi:hypothetical protein
MLFISLPLTPLINADWPDNTAPPEEITRRKRKTLKEPVPLDPSVLIDLGVIVAFPLNMLYEKGKLIYYIITS